MQALPIHFAIRLVLKKKLLFNLFEFPVYYL